MRMRLSILNSISSWFFTVHSDNKKNRIHRAATTETGHLLKYLNWNCALARFLSLKTEGTSIELVFSKKKWRKCELNAFIPIFGSRSLTFPKWKGFLYGTQVLASIQLLLVSITAATCGLPFINSWSNEIQKRNFWSFELIQVHRNRLGTFNYNRTRKKTSVN